MQEPDYQFNLLMEEDHLLGELLCWETQEFIYVEHLCILPQLRGQHCGSRALELLEQRGKPVILEIDPPIDDISCAGKAFMNEPVIGKIRLHTSIRRIGRALQGIRWW